MELISKERLKRIKEEAYDKEIRQNIKSHCTKIHDGIQKNGSTSALRAIWELFQNAGDQTEEATIKITLTPDSFIFAHKGRPFDYDSLLSLVKQVSAREKEGDDTVGQYGTGFLTTHTFSRKIQVTGSMLIENPDIYVNIDRLLIDREFDTIAEFIDKMAYQIKKVNALLDSTPTHSRREWTELRYILNEEGLKKARQAIDEAIRLMPYVLTFNDKITNCEIDDKINKRVISFKKEKGPDEEELSCTKIIIVENEATIEKYCYYLSVNDGIDRIILPLESPTQVCDLKDIPRFFVYYPLIGTENIGVNFLFHSGRFTPEEPRDTIILPKDNDATEKIASENIAVLNEMTEYLWQYLSAHVGLWKNTLKMAVIGIKTTGHGDDITDDFFVQMKKRWVEKFSALPLIDTICGRKAMSDSNHPRVFEPAITDFLCEEESHAYLPALYSYSQEVSLLPYETEILEWSVILNEWGADNKDVFVELDSVVQNISKNKEGDLHKMLELLVKAGKSDFFEKYALLPNREQTLHKQSELYDAEAVTPELYNLVYNFAPDICEKMIDTKYSDLIKLPEYARTNLRSDLNAVIENEEKKHWSEQPYSGSFEKHLIALCSSFSTRNGESKRNILMPIICRFEGLPYQELHIPAWPSDDKSFDLYRNMFLSLVENQMMKISQKDNTWVAQNMEDLVMFVDTARGDDYKKFCTRYPIYPNQHNILHMPSSLIKNMGIDEELREIYESVLGKDLRDMWVHDKFDTFFEFIEQTPQKVSSDIQIKLQDEEFHHPQVLNIIEKIDGKEGARWAKLFGTIASAKEKLFFDSVTENNKRHVYTLMKIRDEAKLQKLADLSNDENIDRIIELGRQALQAEKNEAEHKRYIQELGSYVEKTLLERLRGILNDNILKIDICDEQGGQDFIIRVGDKPVYYVEVKSRWSTKDSVVMSPLQLARSVENKYCYSLCFVDMTWKSPSAEHFYEDVETCVSHTTCINNIGELNEPCIESILDRTDVVHIGGNYTLVVPQKVFDIHGYSFANMIEKIRLKIEYAIRNESI